MSWSSATCRRPSWSPSRIAKSWCAARRCWRGGTPWRSTRRTRREVWFGRWEGLFFFLLFSQDFLGVVTFLSWAPNQLVVFLLLFVTPPPPNWWFSFCFPPTPRKLAVFNLLSSNDPVGPNELVVFLQTGVPGYQRQKKEEKTPGDSPSLFGPQEKFVQLLLDRILISGVAKQAAFPFDRPTRGFSFGFWERRTHEVGLVDNWVELPAIRFLSFL